MGGEAFPKLFPSDFPDTSLLIFPDCEIVQAENMPGIGISSIIDILRVYSLYNDYFHLQDQHEEMYDSMLNLYFIRIKKASKRTKRRGNSFTKIQNCIEYNKMKKELEFSQKELVNNRIIPLMKTIYRKAYYILSSLEIVQDQTKTGGDLLEISSKNLSMIKMTIPYLANLLTAIQKDLTKTKQMLSMRRV